MKRLKSKRKRSCSGCTVCCTTMRVDDIPSYIKAQYPGFDLNDLSDIEMDDDLKDAIQEGRETAR